MLDPLRRPRLAPQPRRAPHSRTAAWTPGPYAQPIRATIGPDRRGRARAGKTRSRAARGIGKQRLARVTGLEPATSGVTGRRSNQLSYTRSGRPRHLEPHGNVVKQAGSGPWVWAVTDSN